MAKKRISTNESTLSLDGNSLDVEEEKLQKVQQLIPEVFTENQIDWEKFKVEFGDEINFEDERYMLSWAGRTSAFRALQRPSCRRAPKTGQ